MKVYRSKVTVQDGGKIEICLDELVQGTEATVVVTVENSQPVIVRPSQMKGYARGIYADQQEVDDYLSSEKDSWT